MCSAVGLHDHLATYIEQAYAKLEQINSVMNELNDLVNSLKHELIDSVSSAYEKGKAPPWFTMIKNQQFRYREGHNQVEFVLFLLKIHWKAEARARTEQRVTEFLAKESRAMFIQTEPLKREMVQGLFDDLDLRRDLLEFNSKMRKRGAKDSLSGHYMELVEEFDKLAVAVEKEQSTMAKEVTQLALEDVEFFAKDVFFHMSSIVRSSDLNKKLLFVDREGRLDVAVVYYIYRILNKIKAPNDPMFFIGLNLINLVNQFKRPVLI